MYEVIIVGSGIVGLVHALLLAKDSALRIAIVDAKDPASTWSETVYDSRVYALTPASQQLLDSLNVWSQIQSKRASPFIRMQVWDARGGGELVFDHAQLNVPTLGYIIEENLLRATLLEKLKDFPSIDLLYPLNLTALQEQQEALELHYTFSQAEQGSDKDLPVQRSLRTKLLIGADGAQSWVREQAGIPLHIQAYQHSALIAQVETTASHHQTARQVFLSVDDFPSGPLAFLPLINEHHCSIVWSTAPAAAEQLMRMNESSFQDIVAQASAFRLGKIQAVSKRQLFPLYERHAEQYVKNRLALIGEAAHSLHPLAGQGLNLGIADAGSLAAVIREAVQKDRDFASLNTLRRYERARRSDNAVMLSTVKLLQSLFASKNKSLALLRNQGLIAIHHFPLLKNFLARYAMGTV